MSTDPLARADDIPAAIGFLTRLPIRVDTAFAQARGARIAWAWPVAGWVVGGLAALVAAVAIAVGLPVGIAALGLVAAQVIVTGALHEDGLADSLDGVWGGWTKDRRLEIMTDSRIGAYGVIGLVLTLALRWQLWVVLIDAGLLWPAAFAVSGLSRAAMAVVMALLGHAKAGGVSRHVGRPSARTSALGCAVATLAALVLLGWSAFAVVFVLAGIIWGWASIARAKIGGQTGDILGATQQWCEIAALLTLVALT